MPHKNTVEPAATSRLRPLAVSSSLRPQRRLTVSVKCPLWGSTPEARRAWKRSVA